MQIWAPRLIGRKIIVFVDNDGARGALIKGVSKSRPSARIVQAFWQAVASHELYVWVERVPSKSNPAAGPSRCEFQWLVENGFAIVAVQGISASS